MPDVIRMFIVICGSDDSMVGPMSLSFWQPCGFQNQAHGRHLSVNGLRRCGDSARWSHGEVRETETPTCRFHVWQNLWKAKPGRIVEFTQLGKRTPTGKGENMGKQWSYRNPFGRPKLMEVEVHGVANGRSLQLGPQRGRNWAHDFLFFCPRPVLSIVSQRPWFTMLHVLVKPSCNSSFHHSFTPWILKLSPLIHGSFTLHPWRSHSA